jgi:hypothetical protein
MDQYRLYEDKFFTALKGYAELFCERGTRRQEIPEAASQLTAAIFFFSIDGLEWGIANPYVAYPAAGLGAFMALPRKSGSCTSERVAKVQGHHKKRVSLVDSGMQPRLKSHLKRGALYLLCMMHLYNHMRIRYIRICVDTYKTPDN